MSGRSVKVGSGEVIKDVFMIVMSHQDVVTTFTVEGKGWVMDGKYETTDEELAMFCLYCDGAIDVVDEYGNVYPYSRPEDVDP